MNADNIEQRRTNVMPAKDKMPTGPTPQLITYDESAPPPRASTV